MLTNSVKLYFWNTAIDCFTYVIKHHDLEGGGGEVEVFYKTTNRPWYTTMLSRTSNSVWKVKKTGRWKTLYESAINGRLVFGYKSREMREREREKHKTLSRRRRTFIYKTISVSRPSANHLGGNTSYYEGWNGCLSALYRTATTTSVVEVSDKSL